MGVLVLCVCYDTCPTPHFTFHLLLCPLYDTLPQPLQLSTLWQPRYDSCRTVTLCRPLLYHAVALTAYACVMCVLSYACVCVRRLCILCRTKNRTFKSAFKLYLFALLCCCCCRITSSVPHRASSVQAVAVLCHVYHTVPLAFKFFTLSQSR